MEKQTGATYNELVYDGYGNLVFIHDRTNWLQDIIPFYGHRSIARYHNGNTEFLHGDALGSSVYITEQPGWVSQKLLFYPWGQRWASWGVLDERFASLGERDAETGNDPTPFRMYQPRLYRWLSPDPVAGDVWNPQSLNRYAYVLNNPTNFIDPLGLDPPEGPPPHPPSCNNIGCVWQYYGWTIPGMFGAEGVCVVDGAPTNCNRFFGPRTEPIVLFDPGKISAEGDIVRGPGVAVFGVSDQQDPSSWTRGFLKDLFSMESFQKAQLDAREKYYPCIGEDLFPFAGLGAAAGAKGVETAVEKAAEKTNLPEKAAGAYLHFTDGRFTAWGKFSEVLVPKAAGVIRGGAKVLGVAGWLYTDVEGIKAIAKCSKRLGG